MVATPVYKANTSVVMVGQVRTRGIGSFYTFDGLSGGNALEHWMKLCLFMRTGQKADAPVDKIVDKFEDPDGKEHKQTRKEIVGHDAVIKVEKGQVAGCKPQGTDIHIPFYWKDGFIKQEISALHAGNAIEDDTGPEQPKKKRGRPKKTK